MKNLWTLLQVPSVGVFPPLLSPNLISGPKRCCQISQNCLCFQLSTISQLVWWSNSDVGNNFIYCVAQNTLVQQQELTCLCPAFLNIISITKGKKIFPGVLLFYNISFCGGDTILTSLSIVTTVTDLKIVGKILIQWLWLFNFYSGVYADYRAKILSHSSGRISIFSTCKVPISAKCTCSESSWSPFLIC